jgi:hypothetical protein
MWYGLLESRQGVLLARPWFAPSACLQRIAAIGLTREELLMKLGTVRAKARARWRLIDIGSANDDTFSSALNRDELRQTRRKGALRRAEDPGQLWQLYRRSSRARRHSRCGNRLALLFKIEA